MDPFAVRGCMKRPVAGVHAQAELIERGAHLRQQLREGKIASRIAQRQRDALQAGARRRGMGEVLGRARIGRAGALDAEEAAAQRSKGRNEVQRAAHVHARARRAQRQHARRLCP